MKRCLEADRAVRQQVKERLLLQLSDNGHSIGDKLPTISELATEFQVSRDTVIKAVKEMVKEGYLESTDKRYYASI